MGAPVRTAAMCLLLGLAFLRPAAVQGMDDGALSLSPDGFTPFADDAGAVPTAPNLHEVLAGGRDFRAPGPWTLEADLLLLRRSTPEALRLPLGYVFGLNADHFDFNVDPGARFRLVRDLANGNQVEVCYGRIESAGNTPSTDLNVVRTTDVTLFKPVFETLPDGTTIVKYVSFSVTYAVSGDIGFDYASDLQIAEINWRSPVWDCVTILAGLRWTQLGESLHAADRGNDLYTIDADNRLFGLQIGADVTVISLGRLRLDALAKGGFHFNHADVDYDFLRPPDSDHEASFIGEIELTAVYQFTPRLALRGGYQAMWLDGLALASDQLAGFSEPLPGDRIPTIDTDGELLLHGANVGIEYIW